MELIAYIGNDAQEKLTLKKSKDLTYTFEFYAPVGKSLVIEPKASADANLLFSPLKKDISVENECVKNIVFQAKSGLIISGQITPATEGVLIKIKNTKTGQDVVTITTDASGAFKAGPLYDDQTYEVEPSKEDYLFTKEAGTYNFKAQKQSTLVLTVKDSTGSPLD